MNEIYGDELVASFLKYIERVNGPIVFNGKDANGERVEIVWDDRFGWGIHGEEELVHLTEPEAATLWQRAQLPI